MNKRVKEYETLVRESARELVRNLADAGHVDLGYAFTQRLPIMTIFRILGIPESDISWTMETGLEMLNRPPGETGPFPRAHECGDGCRGGPH